MAEKKVEKSRIEQPENNPGIFQKLFYVVLIPMFFILAILLIVSMFNDRNVFKYLDELPFVSSKDDQEVINSSAQTEEKLVSLQAELHEKEAEISQFQTKFESSNVEKQDLQAEIEQLQYEIEKLVISQEESKKEFKEILTTFEKMSAKKAAPILVQMSDTEAVRILSNMKPETLTAIFEKMSPADAARYTQLLTN